MFVRVIVGLMVVCVLGVAVLTVMLVMQGGTNGGAAGAGNGAGGGTSTVTADPQNASARSQALAMLRVPEFVLVDQNGTMQNQSVFDGQYTVLSMIFTNCPFACPTIMEQAVRVQNATESMSSGKALRFVSMSVDPANDTPAVLKAYAELKGVDENRWLLLTGPDGAVQTLAEDGLSMFVRPDESMPISLRDGSVMSNIVHPTSLILIGPDRRVIETYDTVSPSAIDRLITYAGSLGG